jgi:uncharacterized protein YraI
MRVKSLFILVMVFMSLGVVQAQTPSITIGENLVAEVRPTVPYDFSFSANQGQTVTIQALAITPGLAPAVAVLEQGAVLLENFDNPLSQSTVSGVVTFEAAGDYIISVATSNGVEGQVLVSVAEGGTPPPPPTPLMEGQTVDDILDPGATTVYSFGGNADPNVGLSPTFTSLDPVRGLSVELSTADGRVLATSSNELTTLDVTIPPNPQGSYLISLTNDHQANVTIRYSLSLFTNTLVEGQPLTPVATLIPLPQTGPCVLTTQGQFVNLRQSPSTGAPIIATIFPTVTYNVIGRNQDTTWYQITAPEGSGWVAASITRQGGDCSAVPVVSAPVATATSAPVITSTSTPTVTSTTPAEATEEPGITPTAEQTAEATEPASP